MREHCDSYDHRRVDDEPRDVLEPHVRFQLDVGQSGDPEDVVPVVGLGVDHLDLLGDVGHGDSMDASPVEQVVVLSRQTLLVE